MKFKKIYIAILFVCVGLPILSNVSGIVTDASGNPLSNVRVRIHADPGLPAITNSNGEFTVISTSGSLELTAALAYDKALGNEYLITKKNAIDGQTGIVIVLEAIPVETNSDYEPLQGASPGGCADCHGMQYDEWLPTRHANAAKNSWVHDIYEDFLASHDPGETGHCATCHSPTASYQTPGSIYLNDVINNPGNHPVSAQEGVTCTACHQLDSVDLTRMNDLHLEGNSTMRFPLSGVSGAGTHDFVWGPLDDVIYPFMKPVYQPMIQDSSLCGSCHQYHRPENGVAGQTTYDEWLSSPFASGPNKQTCQSCHMPKMDIPTVICDPPIGFGGGPERPAGTHAIHEFIGTSLDFLQRAVDVRLFIGIEADHLSVTAEVENNGAGHDFPTGISLRNVILKLEVTSDGNLLTQQSGPVIPGFGSDNNGIQEDGDWAGLPGTAFAKMLAGRVNDQGEEVEPVLFVDAERVSYDNRIHSGETNKTTYRFEFDPSSCAQSVEVTARLVYRRAWRGLAVEKGWTTDALGLPWEFDIQEVNWSQEPPFVSVESSSPFACTIQGTQLQASLWCVNGTPSYQWTGGPIISGSQSSSATVNPIVDTHYSLCVTDQNGTNCIDYWVQVMDQEAWTLALTGWVDPAADLIMDLDGDGIISILDLLNHRNCLQ